MISRPIRTVAALLAATATTAVAGLALSSPADAAPLAKGRVLPAAGLNVRAAPSTAVQSYGSYPQGKVITLLCSVRGTPVNGNTLWFRTPSEGSTWVAAEYVESVGAAPKSCGAGAERFTGRATVKLNQRQAPTTVDAVTGSVARHGSVTVVCSLESEAVGGNEDWYYLGNRRWVAAYYVALDESDAQPVHC